MLYSVFNIKVYFPPVCVPHASRLLGSEWPVGFLGCLRAKKAMLYGCSDLLSPENGFSAERPCKFFDGFGVRSRSRDRVSRRVIRCPNRVTVTSHTTIKHLSLSPSTSSNLSDMDVQSYFLEQDKRMSLQDDDFDEYLTRMASRKRLVDLATHEVSRQRLNVHG